MSSADHSPSTEAVANRLGALALVLTDRLGDAVVEACDQSPTGAAALSWLHTFGHRPSIDLLGRVLGLSSSGTVRLVDRLEGAGLVDRRPGHDGRRTDVVLTAAGHQAAQRVAASRVEVLRDVLGPLSVGQRNQLDRHLSAMLVGAMREPGATRWTCRLCDAGACGHATGGCPVGNAARQRYG